MLTARVGSEIIRAGRNLKGKDFVYRCRDPHCKAPDMLLVAGERAIRIPHFRHKTDTGCKCGMGETAWHLEWKSHFDRVEVDMGIDPENGEMNRADALTDDGVVLEFQHSPISLQEQESRERFYTSKGGMLWIVDANKTRYLKRLERIELFSSMDIPTGEPLKHVPFPDEAFNELWTNRPVGVIFDYGPEKDLFFLLPGEDEPSIAFGRNSPMAMGRFYKREELIDELKRNGKKFLQTPKMVRDAYQAEQERLAKEKAEREAAERAKRPPVPMTLIDPLRKIYQDEKGWRYSDYFGEFLPLSEKFLAKINADIQKRMYRSRRRFRF